MGWSCPVRLSAPQIEKIFINITCVFYLPKYPNSVTKVGMNAGINFSDFG